MLLLGIKDNNSLLKNVKQYHFLINMICDGHFCKLLLTCAQRFLFVSNIYKICVLRSKSHR